MFRTEYPVVQVKEYALKQEENRLARRQMLFQVFVAVLAVMLGKCSLSCGLGASPSVDLTLNLVLFPSSTLCVGEQSLFWCLFQ